MIHEAFTMKPFIRVALLFSLILSNQLVIAQNKRMERNPPPPAPDYRKPAHWSTLPNRTDEADQLPAGETAIPDEDKKIDVFYVYPTLYMSGNNWNADINNQRLNKRIDTKPVRYQASVFNAVGRVYTPRYRQAIIHAFNKTPRGDAALDFAYQDVKRAFQYFIEHYNQGRPFIIASHSQGTHHARRLLQEMIDTTALRERMVAAYVIGFAIYDSMYVNLKPCSSESETGCYITWASFKQGYRPVVTSLYGNVCVNPITWQAGKPSSEGQTGKGGLLLNFNRPYYNSVTARIEKNYLWVKARIPIIRSMTNLHIADYNLFWFDIRANAQQRVQQYFTKTAGAVK